MNLYHPICHFANGERLYYILIDAKTNLFAAKQYVLQCLNEKGLKNSSCGYITFGPNDILLRIWAAEEIVADFITILRSNREIILNVTPRIIESISTWYQNRLEKQGDFWATFDNNIHNNLMNRDFDKSLVYQEKLSHIKNGIKFFTFLEEAYGTISTLFRDLYAYVKDEHSDEYKKLFNNIHYVSIYSFQEETFRGVLLKGQAESLEYITKCIDTLTKKFNILTTTCICAHNLLNEKDELNPSPKKRLPLELRKAPMIYSLLKSHDCYSRKFSNILNAKEHNERFCEILKPLTCEILLYHKSWWPIIDNLRKSYRWVVFQKNAPLKGFLMEQYVSLEKKFRDKIQKHIETKEKVKNRQFKKDNITWGLLERNLGELKEFSKLTKDTKEKIGLLGRSIHACFQNRNDLMHGNITDLFLEGEEGVGVWETHILNLVKLWFSIARYEPVLDNFLSSLIFNKKCQKN